MQEPVALYNWSPVLYLLLLALLIACVPLAWIFRQYKSATPARRLFLLTSLIAFLTFDLILFGAFTRLTDSGLGCPDWPGCYGSASPFGASSKIAQEQLLDPDGFVTWFKAWVEMLHRYFASAIGVLIIVLVAVGCYYRKQLKATPWLAFATLFWVLLQGAFGAWTVTMKLFPAIVTMHLLLGIGLLILLQIQAIGYQKLCNMQEYGVKQQQPLLTWQRVLLVLAIVVLAIQLMLGGWVSTNYAVLACGSEFPSCNNSLGNPYWPEMDFREGFTIWRELHLNADGQYLSLAALTAIHYAHRLVAYLLVLLLLVLVWILRQARQLSFWRNCLLLVVIFQATTGICTVLFNRPILFALLHTAGATLLALVLTSLWCWSYNKKT